MTVKRSYDCDLCNRSPKDPEELVGIYWVSNDCIEPRHVKGVEHHICRPCLTSLRSVNFRAYDTEATDAN